MFHKLSLAFFRLVLLFNLALIFTAGSLAICPPATALLRQHHETPGVLRYHARDSLKDRDGNTWQVLLFPDNSHSTTTYYLRLVGFPGVNSFIHPQALEIQTAEGGQAQALPFKGRERLTPAKILTARDAYAESTPAPNVGQYDLTTIVSQLPSSSLKLAVPLKGDRTLDLKIPREVIEEWQLLTQEIEK